MTGRIPKHFHFVFGLRPQTEPFHLMHYLCIESCRLVNRPDSMTLYYHYEPFGRYWDLVRDKLSLVHVDLNPIVREFHYPVKGIKQYAYAHHADFIRLERLLSTGGVYADIDTLFVNEIPPELYEKPFVLGREDDIVLESTGERVPSLCNALIMSEPNSRFGRLWLDEMTKWFDGTWSNHSTVLPARLSREHPELVHIEPQRRFYKHMWTREGLTTLFEGRDLDTSGVSSIHLWSHLWWSERRRDFSSFSGSRLTERYVRSFDTSYALLARRFLPPPRPALLFVSPVEPSSGGGGRQMRARQVVTALSSRYNVDLLVVGSATGVTAKAPVRAIVRHPDRASRRPGAEPSSTLARFGRGVRFALTGRPSDWVVLTPPLRRTLRAVAAFDDYEVVHVFRLYLGSVARYLARKNPAARMHLDLDDVESLTRGRIAKLQRDNGERARAFVDLANARRYARSERRLLSAFNRVYVCAEEDRRRIATWYGHRDVELLPNVVDGGCDGSRLPPPSKNDPGQFALLFVGALAYVPNRDAAAFFCAHVLPLVARQARAPVVFRIIGGGANRSLRTIVARTPGAELLGPVEELDPWYAASRIAVAPVRAGGGTRVKILEAFSRGVPVVSTTIGAEGLPVEHGVHLLLADSAAAFAECCLRIASDDLLASRLVANAHEVLESIRANAFRGLLT